MSEQEKQKKYDYWVCRTCNKKWKQGLCPCNGILKEDEIEKLARANCGSKLSCSECVGRNSNVYFTSKESCSHFVYAKLKVEEKMKDAKNIVEQELKELEEKQQKLGVFIENDLFATMTEKEQRLLVFQYRIMERYAWILKQRLKIWREI